MSLRYVSTAISFEAMIRADYIADRIDLNQFETEIEAVLRGDAPLRCRWQAAFTEPLSARVGRPIILGPGMELRTIEGMETRGELR